MYYKFGIYYNNFFNCFIVSLSTQKHNQIIQKKNITILKYDDQIVGINLFNTDIPIAATGFINNNNQQVIAYLNQALKGIVKLQPTPQFLVGQITEAQPIANTHLSLCQVNVGAGKSLDIVCGAHNAKVGLISVVATINAWMPNGQQIQQGNLRGYQSFGMLCSATELQIKKFNKLGIIELPQTYANKLGANFWEVF